MEYSMYTVMKFNLLKLNRNILLVVQLLFERFCNECNGSYCSYGVFYNNIKRIYLVRVE